MSSFYLNSFTSNFRLPINFQISINMTYDFKRQTGSRNFNRIEECEKSQSEIFKADDVENNAFKRVEIRFHNKRTILGTILNLTQ